MLNRAERVIERGRAFADEAYYAIRNSDEFAKLSVRQQDKYFDALRQVNLADHPMGPAIMRDLERSPISHRILELQRKNIIDTRVSNRAIESLTDYGTTYPGTNTALVYPRTHSSFGGTARTTIHEGIHQAGMGGSQRAEILARIAEWQHAGIKPTF